MLASKLEIETREVFDDIDRKHGRRLIVACWFSTLVGLTSGFSQIYYPWMGVICMAIPMFTNLLIWTRDIKERQRREYWFHTL